MPPPPGSAVRAAVSWGGFGSDATGWWTMARRAVSALAAVFAFAAVVAAIAVTAGPAPAAAAAGAASQPPATVTFTGLSPQWAGPGTTVTVTGVVKNAAAVARRLTVQLYDSTTPLTSVSDLQPSAPGGSGPAVQGVPGATWTSEVLKPGASATWSFRLPAGVLGLTGFGVYPLAAEVMDGQGTNLNNAQTYLPYVPATKGPYGSSIPRAQKISWVWPLIDRPLLTEPWQSACSGPEAAALAQSLRSGGRLGQLLDAASGTAGTAAVQAQAVQAGTGHATKDQTARTGQPQSLAGFDGLTWAVDPALLTNVTALAGCGSTAPQWAQAATAWLARLKAATADQQLFVTPYGDPDTAALIGAGKAADVKQSFFYGRQRARQILGRDLNPQPPGSVQASQAQPTSLAWSAAEPVSYPTLENLAAVDWVDTLLVSSSAFPAAQTSVLRTLDGVGSYMNVLLANDSLSSLLGSAGSAPGSAFATAQDFLAETALMAQQDPSSPIIVAPPQRWQPPAGLASTLLKDTATAPWLSPATLTSLTAARHIPAVRVPADNRAPGVSAVVLDRLGALDRQVAQLQTLRAEEDPDLYLAVSTVESSAYAGRFRSIALGMIATLTSRLAWQQQAVRIVAENRITLGGTRGNVPVSIENHLGSPVEVSLHFDYDQVAGTRVTASPPGLVRVAAHTAQTVRLRITAGQPGSTTITMTLANRDGQPLATPSVRMTVQTTQVGLLGMIIFAAALGVFLIASAARAVRRGKPRPDAGGPPDSGPSDDHEPGHSTQEAAPDTVVSERSELGTAGTPRPR